MSLSKSYALTTSWIIVKNIHIQPNKTHDFQTKFVIIQNKIPKSTNVNAPKNNYLFVLLDRLDYLLFSTIFGTTY